MPLIEVADLKITLDQIVETKFLPGNEGSVTVRVGDEVHTRHLDAAAFNTFLKRVMELQGISSGSRS